MHNALFGSCMPSTGRVRPLAAIGPDRACRRGASPAGGQVIGALTRPEPG